MILAFCEFNFIMKHFKMLKTVSGKGFFNLFVASMFLVGNGDDIWGWIMMGGLIACGLFFILVGCACINGYEDNNVAKINDSASRDEAKESLV